MSDDRLKGLANRSGGDDGGDDIAAAVLVAAIRLLRVDGAAVLLMVDETRWTTTAASDSTIAALVDLEQTLADGPSVDAYRTGGPVLVPDLSAARARWPLLLPAVADVRAYFSFPLQIGAVRLGVLDLYRRHPGRLDDRDLALALQLTDSTAVALVDQRHVDGATDPASWPAPDEHYRPEIDQAAGMLSVLLSTDIPTAYARMRAHAFAASLPLVEVATAIVLGTLHLDTEAAQPDQED